MSPSKYFLFFSSQEHKVQKVSYCDCSVSVVRHQQFSFNDYSYTPGPTDSKLSRKVRDDL